MATEVPPTLAVTREALEYVKSLLVGANGDTRHPEVVRSSELALRTSLISRRAGGKCCHPLPLPLADSPYLISNPRDRYESPPSIVAACGVRHS